MRVISPELTIAQIVAANPAAEERLAELGIDNCCGAHATLLEHCHRLRLDPGAVIAHLDAFRPSAVPHEHVDLCDAVRGSVVSLQELGRRVAAVHGTRDARLGELLTVLELLDRAARQRPRVSCCAAPPGIGAPEREVAALLARAGELTDGFTVPEHACGSWAQLINLLVRLHAQSLPTTGYITGA